LLFAVIARKLGHTVGENDYAGCQKSQIASIMTTPHAHPRDPLHGITLEMIINQLVQRHGWREMARRIPIRCFMFNPTVTSSLTFLRKNPWARKKVEDWFIGELGV
jgi:hypothetical protein